jgi:Zn-dependent protease
MSPNSPGSYHLFTLAGIRVSVHWTWFVALYFLYAFSGLADTLPWFLVTYVSLFAIVLMHEFGHAFACRSVGGEAHSIVLWPLGGIAFVKPPPRPGALLWSIAAGPLVNFVLVPITFVVWFVAEGLLGSNVWPGLLAYIQAIALINLGLLIFNMMPVYPLDGGQMLHAVLWFFMGRAKSLRVAASIGVVIGAIVGVLALMAGDWWMVMIAIFVGMQAWNGLKVARILAIYER